jgi:hypothetical protein
MIKTRLRRVFLFKIEVIYFVKNNSIRIRIAILANDNWDFVVQTNSYLMEKHREFLILDLLK